MADWKCFCLLTGELVERLPPLDTTNIEKAYQELHENLWLMRWRSIFTTFTQHIYHPHTAHLSPSHSTFILFR